ncbi:MULTISPECIES: hypothetical protein [unclassified Terrabacter]|uniref:hypothetical protein n=1 Tax=unclassified Terrabacter TaxID=2630222 RepID=UPI0006F3B874|nr:MULTISPECIES: hypothetical protein [unclassified Terrabacter]KRB46944.1 hypothetical protein ASD90_00675 [Terrabacter sp. Root181]KRF38181.1 hypothetical protein ASG96_17085 [Terrabacter sp. Soil810]
MTDHDLHVDDAELLARLRRIADTVDPVPEDVVELGRAAFELRHTDAILMTMAAEALSGADLRAAGDQGSSRLHVFEHDGVSIEVEVTARGEFARAVGIVDDSSGADLSGAHVSVETTSSSMTVDLEGGRFTVERVPLRLARIVLERSGERLMVTPWFDVG